LALRRRGAFLPTAFGIGRLVADDNIARWYLTMGRRGTRPVGVSDWDQFHRAMLRRSTGREKETMFYQPRRYARFTSTLNSAPPHTTLQHTSLLVLVQAI
jgi:hypothetical protein